MLLRNITTQRVDSVVIGQPKLDNFYTTKKIKKKKAPKLAKGSYGIPFGSGISIGDGDGDADDGGSGCDGGGDGGGAGGAS